MPTYTDLQKEYGYRHLSVFLRALQPIRQELWEVTGRKNRLLVPKQVALIHNLLGPPEERFKISRSAKKEGGT